MKYITLFISLCLFQNLFAQGILPSDWGLRKFQLKDEKFGEINFYVTGKGISHREEAFKMIIEWIESN